MTTKLVLFRMRYALIILFSCAIAKADVLDVISPETQPGDNLCWAACADMLLQYYDNDPNLNGLWATGTDISAPDVTNGLCSLANSYDTYDVHDLLNSNNNSHPVASTCNSGTIDLADIVKDLTNAKPIIAGLSDNNSGHMVLIVGEKSDGTILYNDPETGSQESKSYDLFCTNGTIWYWAENLVPNSGSPTGSVPILVLSIRSGPTQFSYPGSNATFTSLFTCPGVCNPPPTQWSWTLFFQYKGGNYTISSQTVNGQNTSTWNVPAFTLPTTGYQWLYNESGFVTGEVYVSGGGYSNWETITYAPQTLIPANVTFNSQNVSGSHAEVDAHYGITMTNDQITSTGVINFKAGETINILPETKILPSSSVKMTIDPTLQ